MSTPFAAFCGHCGAALASGAQYCARCGAATHSSGAVAPPPPGYAYPTVPDSQIPFAGSRISPLLWVLAAAAVTTVVVALTLVLGSAQPKPAPPDCQFACEHPAPGPLLISPTLYRNSQFGYSVEYIASEQGVTTSVTNQTASGMTLSMTQQGQQLCQVQFIAASGTSNNAAVVKAVGNLDTTHLQDLQPMGEVRGAEIGAVLGVGSVYKGSYVPSSGGQASPIILIVMAATQNGVTITTVALGPYTTDQTYAPYGMAGATLLDLPITLTHFAGST